MPLTSAKTHKESTKALTFHSGTARFKGKSKGGYQISQLQALIYQGGKQQHQTGSEARST